MHRYKKVGAAEMQHPLFGNDLFFGYQITTLLEGARYMPSVFFTL